MDQPLRLQLSRHGRRRRRPSLAQAAFDVEPSTSATPPPRKKKKEDALLDFVKVEAAREEERFKASQQVNEASTKRFLDLFEKLVNK